MTHKSQQQGAALVVVLILLLVMTILGLVVVRGTALSERMSANMYDRSLAFQQAETALREAEQLVRDTVIANGNGWVIGVKCGPDPTPGRGGATGIADATQCGLPDAAVAGTICAGNGSLTSHCWRNVSADRLQVAGLPTAGAPQYMIQFMGLRDAHEDLNLGSGAGTNQYGGGGGSSVQEALFRIVARSHNPAAAGGQGRSLVVLQSNVAAR